MRQAREQCCPAPALSGGGAGTTRAGARRGGSAPARQHAATTPGRPLPPPPPGTGRAGPAAGLGAMVTARPPHRPGRWPRPGWPAAGAGWPSAPSFFCSVTPRSLFAHSLFIFAFARPRRPAPPSQHDGRPLALPHRRPQPAGRWRPRAGSGAVFHLCSFLQRPNARAVVPGSVCPHRPSPGPDARRAPPARGGRSRGTGLGVGL